MVCRSQTVIRHVGEVWDHPFGARTPALQELPGGLAECWYPLDLLSLTVHYVTSAQQQSTADQRFIHEEIRLPNFLTKLVHALGIALVSIIALRAPVAAQTLPQLPPGMTTEDTIELFRTSPEFRDLVRVQLLSSGLTPSQIRRLLEEAGYPATLVDVFLATESPVREQTEDELLATISTLGIAPQARQVETPSAAPTADTTGVQPAVEQLALFGLDVFQGDGAAFEIVVAGPVDGSYRLGPGDHLVLLITGSVEISHELEVTRQGFIVIPRVGQVFVNSLTLDQLRQVLYDRLGQRFSGITRSPDAVTKFDIVVAHVRTQSVRVVGEVVRPGTYQVSAAGGVMSALYRAGGINQRGSFRTVHVKRGASLVAEIDIYEYLLRGVIETDVVLEPGDVIFVPVHGPRVKIAGEITRPAIYELRPGENLQTLIEIAGGVTPYASTRLATVDRVLPPNERPAEGNARRVLTVSLENETGSDAITETPLMAADSVTIFPIRGARRNTVKISGGVWQPGTYQLESGMQLWDLIEAAGGLRPDTYEGRAQIRRLQPDSSRHLVGVVLSASGNPMPRDNPELEEADEVTIFSRTEFRPRRYITVQGSVRRPRVIEFTDSMTLRDAILLAQGLTDDAYLLEAEVSRLRSDASGSPDSMVTIFKVPMDSSYVFDASSYVTRSVATNAPDELLYPYDNIYIRRIPGWEGIRQVTISGEVRFPGAYTLATPGERLSSLVARAGGITPAAYPEAVQFVRRQDGIGRIALDLPEVLQRPDHHDNLVLAPGDSIHIPRFIPTVRVDGAVNFPASVTYVAGAGIGYYIGAAGGATHQADKGKAFVQQPNGLVAVGTRPEPGAVVIVPQKDPNDRGVLQLLPFFAAIVQVFATTATLVIALSR